MLSFVLEISTSELVLVLSTSDGINPPYKKNDEIYLVSYYTSIFR